MSTNEQLRRSPEQEGTAKTVATMLVMSGAVRVDLDNPATFHSGIKSPIFVDCSYLYGEVGERSLVADLLSQRVRQISAGYEYDSVVGVPMGALGFATLAADRLGKKNPYWSTTKMKMEGAFNPDDKVVVVEDMVTTGGSTISLAEKVRGQGGVVDKVVSIASYALPEAAENFADAELEYTCLTDVFAIFEALQKRGKISDREDQVLQEWIKDPRAWQLPR